MPLKASLQCSDESVHVLGTCCPTGDKAAIHQVPHGEPLFENEILLQTLDGILVQQDKLLISRGIAVHLISLGDKGVTQTDGLFNCMT